MDVNKMKKQISDAFNRETETKIILCCSCFRMDKKASEAFALKWPNEPLPNIIKGRDRIYKYAKNINNDHIMAISKISGKFAYYIKLENNKITEEWDLLKGRRVA